MTDSPADRLQYQFSRHERHIELEVRPLRVRLDAEGALHLALLDNGSWIDPSPGKLSQSTPMIGVEGPDGRLASLRPELNSVPPPDEVVELFGPGLQLRVPWCDHGSPTSPLEAEVLFEWYPRFPALLLTRFRVKCPANFAACGPLSLVLNSVLLDSTALMGGAPGFPWAYHGSAETREHCLQELAPGDFKRNYLGVTESFDGGGADPTYRFGTQPGFGGGVPLADIWGRSVGVAVGHAETRHTPVSVPVRVSSDGRIGIELRQAVRTPVPGDRWFPSVRGFLLLHRGDFFNALAAYRELLAAAGEVFPEASREAYEPQWDSWGFHKDYTREQVLSMIPHLREMGIRWMTLDDRWFDAVGDWMPRTDVFPRGERDLEEFIETCHQEGMRVKLWTIPVEADPDPDLDAWRREHPRASIEIRKHPHHAVSRLYEAHPGWMIRDPEGRLELSKRGNAFACGSLPGVRKHFYDLTVKMFRDWRIDGLKQDAVYICPACHDPQHCHTTPDEASEAYEEILRIIYETATRHCPHAVVLNCPCGTPVTPGWVRWQNQSVTADPWTSWVNRGVLKSLKGLIGPRAAVLLDHVEAGDEGYDFSPIGAGGIPATRIAPDGAGRSPQNPPITFEERKRHGKRWISLYREHGLAAGEYLNLYDFIFDVPETHVIRKGSSFYYGIYPGEPDGIVADGGERYRRRRHTKRYEGPLVLRGLPAGGRFQVVDYERGRELGIVCGERPTIRVGIDHHLLLRVTPLAEE